MVVDLCQPHFNTIIHCNKLCADGYDVTNLVSADPALRRRGFKLEYFLRPPVQVTLKFGFQVELCRVDVEMCPWGLDKGQTCKKLEISTSSDRIPSSNFGSSHKQNQQKDKQMQDQEEQKRRKQNHGSKFHQRNGHQWSLQAQQLGEEAQPESQQTDRMFKYQSNPMPSNPESEFKLVGRCEIREGTRVCFTRSNFRPRPPFPSLPPPKPSNCWQEELWSRGPLTLGAVTQLRVNMPFGGAASALGLKALVVWGQPARCCTREEVERIKKVHEDSEKLLPRPVLFASSVTQTKHQQANPNPSNLSIPEEFLDPITQEVMTLPMLLPNGVSVDNTTLEEHQKREATWGRPPNDPFTGVPFTSSSYPLPNPHLKNRIDHFFLQTGMMKRDGILGRREEAEDPQASRLVVCNISGQTENMSCFSKSSTNNTAIQYKAGPRNINCIIQKEENGLRQSKNGIQTFNSQPVAKNSRSILERKSKIDLHRKSTVGLTVEKDPLSQTKRPRLSFDHTSPAPSCSSHEQRLSASLDEALFSALEGRPSFTSNLTQQRSVTPELEPPNISQNSRAVGSHGTPTGQRTCSSCSCSVSVYSKSTLSIYRLTCDHLLCHSCLKQKPQPLNSVTIPTPSHILCPACHSPTPRSDIVRVHH